MASRVQQHSFPVPGHAVQPRYEELREERAGMQPEGLPLASTVIHMPQEFFVPPPPRDHFVWSLVSSLYFNFCCLGVLALNFSVKARDRKLVGDHSGASSYGSTAKCLNILALVLTLLLVVVAIIVVTSGGIALSDIIKLCP